MGKNAILQGTTEANCLVYAFAKGVNSYLVHDILEGIWAIDREANE
jgi:hypothetical protein